MIQQLVTNFLKRNRKVEIKARKEDGRKSGNYRTEKYNNRTKKKKPSPDGLIARIDSMGLREEQ